MLPEPLVAVLRTHYALDWDGTHGWSHWVRVQENGLRLARTTGADLVVVELFAVLHDLRRESDNEDPDHGRRAAVLIERLPAGLLPIEGDRLRTLVEACALHADGGTVGDATTLTCWDADRLDLGRVGIRPDPRLLCTAAARDPGLMAWAWRRSATRA